MKNAFRPCGHAPPQSVTQLHGVCIFCYRDRLGTETARLREHAVILAATVEEGSLLLQQALDALEYHREQTWPIQRTEDAIAALRVRLGPNSAREFYYAAKDAKVKARRDEEGAVEYLAQSGQVAAQTRGSK